MEEKIFELMTKMYVEMQDMKSCMATKEDIGEVKQEIVGVKEDVGVLKEDVAGLKKDVGVLKEDVAGLKEDVGVLKEDVTGLREDMVTVKGNIVGLKQDVSRLENNVMDKVEALFDAREVQMESDAEIVRNLKQVQDKVTEIEIRVIGENFRES